MTLWLLTVWAQIAGRIVGWTLGNDPDRDRAYVLARIDANTAERTIKLVRGDYDTVD